MPSIASEHPIRPPSRLLLLAEARALWETAAGFALSPLLQLAPRGDGHAVLVLPGLAAGDATTALLRRYLNKLGYAAHGWGQGTNFGPRAGVEQGMVDLLRQLADDSGGKVSIVGWSLGGLYARMLASTQPELVRGVVTLGSPFAGNVRSTNAWRLYQFTSGQSVDDIGRMELARATPPMPTTSIYSRSDGVVAWHCSLQAPGPQAENIEVLASHLGLGGHPAVLYAVADRLSQAEGAWRPFNRRRLGPLVYPAPAQPA